MSKTTVVPVVLLMLLVQKITADYAAGREEILRRMLPVYGLAAASSNALHGNDYVKCRSELELFRRAVDDRILWAMKSTYYPTFSSSNESLCV